MTTTTSGVAALLISLVPAASAQCGIVSIFEDKSLFDSLLGDVTAIDFIAPDGVSGQIPADTYASLGVTLSSSPQSPEFPFLRVNDPFEGFEDGWGLVGPSASGWSFAFDFESPIHGFGLERTFAGGFTIQGDFYSDGSLVGSNLIQIPPVHDGTYFVGWVTSFEFDRIVLKDYLVVDNIYFQTVPAPSALVPLALCLVRGRRARSDG